MVYKRTTSLSLELDLYWIKPPDTNPKGQSTPLVIWIHGGGWRGGYRQDCRHALSLIEIGFAVASVSYRLSHQATFPAQIEDCRAAVRWLRAHGDYYNLDTSRFGTWGVSAGGHLAALLGTTSGQDRWQVGDHPDQSSDVQAVCDWFGPTDFFRMNDITGTIDHESADSPESMLIGGPIRNHRTQVIAANPITYISNTTPPFLIMHGQDDRIVLPNQSELLHKALKRAGVNSELILLSNFGHEFSSEQTEVVKNFFNEHLGKG